MKIELGFVRQDASYHDGMQWDLNNTSVNGDLVKIDRHTFRQIGQYSFFSYLARHALQVMSRLVLLSST